MKLITCMTSLMAGYVPAAADGRIASDRRAFWHTCKKANTNGQQGETN